MFGGILRRAVLPAALVASAMLGGCYAYPAGYYGSGVYYGSTPYAYGYGYPGYVGVGVIGGWGYGGYGWRGPYGYGRYGGWGYRGGYGWGGGYRGGYGGRFGGGFGGGFRGGVSPGGHGGVGSPGSWHH